MNTCEDLNDSSSNEENKEEVNLCLMVDASTNKRELALNASSDDEDSHPNDTDVSLFSPIS